MLALDSFSRIVYDPTMEADASESKLLELPRKWQALHQDPPEVLYHYTAAPGLLGILDSGKLWATNARYLNDPSELRYAASLLKDELMQVEKTSPKESFTAALLDLLAKHQRLDAWVEHLLSAFDRDEIYITCFCENGDLLSQWRGYGAHGGGYSVGFDSSALVGDPDRRDPGQPNLLRRVIYDRQEQRELLSSWIQLMTHLEKEWHKIRDEIVNAVDAPAEPTQVESLVALAMDTVGASTGFIGQILVSLLRAEALRGARAWSHLDKASPALTPIKTLREEFERFLGECLICFKDPDYFEEREWRLIRISTPEAEVRFRPSGGAIVPYVERDLLKMKDGQHELPIRSICIGPTLALDTTERALKMLRRVSSRMTEAVAINKSRIPFRG